MLERESAEFFLRTRDAVFPGMTIAEIFGITEGPLHEEIVKNIINVNGDDHRRLRNLVNPALAPRAVARYRPAMRAFLAELLDGIAPRRRVRVHRRHRQALPVAGHRARAWARRVATRPKLHSGPTSSSASSTPPA